MFENPSLFYQSEKEKYQVTLDKVSGQLKVIAMLRFSVFLATVFCIYFFLGNAKAMFFSGILGSCIFTFFLLKYLKLKREKQELELLIGLNQTEINALNGNYSDLETGEEFLDASHFFSFDIDLFGKSSFFQFVNRTATAAGKKQLAKWFSDNTIEAIEDKQKSIQELSKKPQWRQKFTVLALLVPAETSSKETHSWLQNYVSFLPSKLNFFTPVFSIVSVAIMFGMYFQILAFGHLLVWFFIGLGISGSYLKKVNNLSLQASKAKNLFQQYHPLIAQIEGCDFIENTNLLQAKKFFSKDKKASEIVKIFSKLLDALDQRNNILIAIVGNGLFLMDLKNALKIEQWIANYGLKSEEWFDAVAYFDAQNSLANFAFNHPTYAFPVLVKDSSAIVNATEIAHPLISSAKRIPSDCKINAQQFFIVTGANMAGKSTFLRTLSLSIVMANVGLPVCASRMEYKPTKLITSMRTSDSLTQESSYFFSELTRLKFIVEALKTDSYFIVLDEILKGTNSVDKAVGSQKFVEKLIHLKATGIIATHDLSLCEIENDYTNIQNYYLDAEIVNDELYFDYKLKKGICKNRNASFLLKKMEIV